MINVSIYRNGTKQYDNNITMKEITKATMLVLFLLILISTDIDYSSLILKSHIRDLKWII